VRVADYYQQRGMGGSESVQMVGAVRGGIVRAEAVAHGIQSGLRCLSLFVGGAGLLVTALLMLPRKQNGWIFRTRRGCYHSGGATTTRPR
jgi:hypothetical protein